MVSFETNHLLLVLYIKKYMSFDTVFLLFNIYSIFIQYNNTFFR